MGIFSWLFGGKKDETRLEQPLSEDSTITPSEMEAAQKIWKELFEYAKENTGFKVSEDSKSTPTYVERGFFLKIKGVRDTEERTVCYIAVRVDHGSEPLLFGGSPGNLRGLGQKNHVETYIGLKWKDFVQTNGLRIAELARNLANSYEQNTIGNVGEMQLATDDAKFSFSTGRGEVRVTIPLTPGGEFVIEGALGEYRGNYLQSKEFEDSLSAKLKYANTKVTMAEPKPEENPAVSPTPEELQVKPRVTFRRSPPKEE